MTVTTYSGWLADGSPWSPSNPARALSLACKAHGVTFGILGNIDHLTAARPEDHCPYSHTPWPGAQPYPRVLAVDLMTTDHRVAERIIAARRDGQYPCVKYMNYTNAAGAVRHIAWEPTEQETSSSDSGHIHVSFRTDHVDCGHSFDPFIDSPEDFMATISQNDWDALIWRIEALANGHDNYSTKAPPGVAGQPVMFWGKVASAVVAALPPAAAGALTVEQVEAAAKAAIAQVLKTGADQVG